MNAEEYAKSVGGTVIRGQIQIKAGTRAGEGTVSTFINKALADEIGVSRPGMLTCYLGLDVIQAMVEESGLKMMGLGSLVVVDIREVPTQFKDANGVVKTRITGNLMGIYEPIGGLQKSFDWDKLGEVAKINGQMANQLAAATAAGALTIGA